MIGVYTFWSESCLLQTTYLNCFIYCLIDELQ